MSFREQALNDPLLSEASGRSLLKSISSSRHSNSCASLDHCNNPGVIPKLGFQIQNPWKILARVLLVLGIYIGVGILCFFTVVSGLEGEKTNAIVDALYFCFVTMTTVGYGDLIPSGNGAKLLTCVFVFLGFGVLGFLLGSVADYLFEKEKSLLAHAIYAKEIVEHQEFSRLFQANNSQYKVVVVGVVVLTLFLTGVGVLVKVEGLSLIDAFYTVCGTVTTLGYGDKSFHTTGGRLFAVFWILVSTICVGQLFLHLTELQIERNRNSFMQWVLTRKTTTSDLEADDIDHDRRVSATEFVVFKLKEMGKIDEDDVNQILKEFHHLDVGESGFLTQSDLCNRQDNET